MHVKDPGRAPGGFDLAAGPAAAASECLDRTVSTQCRLCERGWLRPDGWSWNHAIAGIGWLRLLRALVTATLPALTGNIWWFPPPPPCQGQPVAKTAQPFSAASRQLSQLVEPGDEIVATFWGLTGWSMNLWMVTNQFFAVLVILPFILNLPRLYDVDIALAFTVGVLLSASYLTRPALVIAVTRRRQLLCCRTSRPFHRRTISQAPIETARLADFRRGWLFSRLRYMGPGTKGSTVRLNVPAACRDAAQATAEASAPGSANSP